MTVRISLPDEQTRDRFSDLDVDSVVWDFSGPPPADGPPLDLAVRPYVLTGDLSVLDAHRVRAVQAQSLGYDDAIGNVPDGITWCNAVGVHEGATAEIALGLVLSAQRDLDRYARAMTTGTWEKTWTPGLIGLTVLLVGHG
ncbi:MAG: hydroxyacid dehydrogenase, partial [Actinomycetales bacterium]